MQAIETGRGRVHAPAILAAVIAAGIAMAAVWGYVAVVLAVAGI